MRCWSRLRSSLLFAGSLMMAASACGDSATGPGAVFIVIVGPVGVTLHPGATSHFTATPLDSHGAQVPNRVVTWRSDDSTVATVSAAGLVTAVAPGVATISAIADGVQGVAGVTVTLAPVAVVDMTPDSASVRAGDTLHLTVTMRDSGGVILTGRILSFTSLDTTKAVVSDSGRVIARDSGVVEIHAASEGVEDTAVVTVTLAATITVVPGTASVMTDSTLQLTAVVQRANGDTLQGYPVVWTSDNKGVALVSTTGVVTAVAPGSAMITATSAHISGQATVTVFTAAAAAKRHRG